MNYQSLSMGVLALAVVAGSAAAFASEEATVATHDGKVVSITSSQLVMTGKDGKQHTHTLAADARVTLDGRECKADDLKAGTKIRVTTRAADATAATAIEAIEKNKLFANTHEGQVVSASDSMLVMTDSKGREHSHPLTTATKVTCDGKVCKATDLKAGWKIRVTTKSNDESRATCVEAIDKNSDFV